MQTAATYRFQLDGSNREAKRKIKCPSCGAKGSFTRYRDYETGLYIDDAVGACDRSNKCQYHMKPKEWFSLHPDKRANNASIKADPLYEPKPLVHIPFEALQATLSDYNQNSFINSLLECFPAKKIEKAVSEYYLGTISSPASEGNSKSVVFWFIDCSNNIRAGQVKQFDPNCKTVKITIEDRDIKAFWIHKLLKKQHNRKGIELPQWLKDYEQAEKVTCLFGEHLLNKYPGKPVALVEAPKSAIIGSIMYPDLVWLATSSLSYLTKQRCRVLQGRNVVLFPDCGVPNKRTGLTCLDQWKDRVSEFEEIARFAFSTLLEENTTTEQKDQGFDIADLILSEVRGLQKKIHVTTDEIKAMPVCTKTGRDFGNLMLATLWLHDGRRYDALYDQAGQLITAHPQIEALSQFFNKSFQAGSVDGQPALLSIVNN
jgi:hypothetical protein